MIPSTLTIKNFLSYGPQPQEVNFQNYQLICLTGKNGHGKSALLDAITWALWGQARKMNGVARGDEQLVHLGQDHMLVSFDFESNGAYYRVIREYSKLKGKKSLSELQFGILDTASNQFIPKTGKTARETQELITKTIGLSFEGCTNSIFLRQGLSHEFSKKSPQERKEVLSAILGLSHLEEYRNKTLALIRDLTREKKQTEQSIEQAQQKIKSLTNVPEEFASAQKQLITIEEQLSKLSTELATKQKELEGFHEQYNQWMVNKKEWELSEKRYQETFEQLKYRINEWQSLRKQLAAAQNSNDLICNQEDLQNQLLIIHNQKSSLIGIEEKLLTCKTKLQALEQEEIITRTTGSNAILKKLQAAQTMRTIHEQEHNKHQLELRNYQQILAEKNEPTICSARLKEIIRKTNYEIKQTENRIALCDATQKNAKNVQTQLANEQNETKHALEILDGDGSSVCPTCSQSLPTEEKIALVNRYKCILKKQKHWLQRQLQRQNVAEQLMQKYKKSLQTTVDQYAQAQIEAENIQKKEQEYNAITQEINKKNKAINATKAILTQITEQITQIEEQKFFYEREITKKYEEDPVKNSLLQEYEALNTIRTELKIKLATSDETTLHSQLKKIESSKKERTLIEQARQKKLLIIQEIRPLIHSVKQQQQALHTLSKNLQEQKESLQKNTVRNDLGQLTSQISTQQDIKNNLFKTISILEVQNKMLEEQRTILHKLYTHNQAITTHLDEYQIISNALGKNGIQALIIENVLPEIEMEANAILSRLSNNNTQIAFESIKDLKNGASRETLDIHISDTMGIRPYELFSGGEAFRIDFAIRIALSKLLAKRSGKRLQTLIIDEGFGSQDQEGLEKILEALWKIQDDFEKIIVVSHLDEMKSQFPANFIIEKSANGSHITVVEQW